MVMQRIFGVLGGGAQQAPARPGYPTTLVIADGDGPYNTAGEVLALVPSAGVRARIWEKTVPAQITMRYGFGNPALPGNQGHWWFVVMDATTDFNVGVVTLAYEGGQRHNFIPIEEKNDTLLHLGTVTSLATAQPTLKDSMQALPEGGSQGLSFEVGQDSRLVINYYTITAATSADVAAFAIPATIIDL